MPLDTIAGNMPNIMDFPEPDEPHTYEGRSLFVTGSRSNYVRREHRETILRLFPPALFATIESAGHWVQAEAPEAFARVVGGFLDSPA